MTLVARAPGKVNLCLFIGPARADGLHELVSLVQPLSLADELSLRPAPDSPVDTVHCPGVEGPNLAAAALAAFRAHTGWDAPPQRLAIAKHVPVAAGMGGGSADAAATLRLAARAAGRDGAGLRELAFGLGADVPAQLAPGLCVMAGAGEEVVAVPERAPFGVTVVPSPHALATAAVFAEADRLGPGRSRAELAELRAALHAALQAGDELPPAELLVNDLEPAARSLRPEVAGPLADLRAAGAAVAMVSGSGPTVFGLFPGAQGPGLAAAAAAELATRHPGAAAALPVDAGFAAAEAATGTEEVRAG
jgi:4-diphosphocytidyl-2-C-methyl-D-erythritol kinase